MTMTGVARALDDIEDAAEVGYRVAAADVAPAVEPVTCGYEISCHLPSTGGAPRMTQANPRRSTPGRGDSR